MVKKNQIVRIPPVEKNRVLICHVETDVYKRQVMIQCRAKYNRPMTEEVKEFVELFKRKKLKRTERKAAVSYTHLDVYKRQVLYLIFWKCD